MVMRASCCIEMIFTEYPFLERIKKAAEAGFDAIEFWGWWDKDLPAIKAMAQSVGIAISTFSLNRTGSLICPGHRAAFLAGAKKGLEKGKEMGVLGQFLLTDELDAKGSAAHRFPELSEEEKYQSVLEGMRELAPLAEAAGITLLLEPLNTYVDHPGYFLNHSAPGLELVRMINSPSVKLLYDIYHMQVMEGNIIETITNNLDAIGYIHFADVPGRYEPGTGELNYANIFRALRKAGYEGYVGFEFKPTGKSEVAVEETLRLFRDSIS